MTETAIVGENIEVVQAGQGVRWTSFSWAIAIAGAIAAIAVSLMIVALGSGIGLSLASPYSGPSAGTLTAAGAVWLILAQTAGFATGGYLAARLLGISPLRSAAERRFRDAAHGLMVWAIAVVFGALLVAGASAFALGTGALVAGMVGAGAAQGTTTDTQRNSDAIDYYVDRLFRVTAPQTGGETPGASGAPPAAAVNDIPRAEITRILAAGVRQGRLADEDRVYLARVVAARTGLSQQEAERRVADIEAQVRESIKKAADTAAAAGAYFSFWMFMSLLFGAVAATVGAMVGGELRDEDEFATATLAR
jgi:hypothetical protein